ncbi:MAG: OmpA family protein [Cyclobacteriaceae bacterium]|nr:OmpA family protein [Cyclobacteriaceae bacterium]MCH8516586.1 OmpA family protein [Cyclobacteriaceae bacterium]
MKLKLIFFSIIIYFFAIIRFGSCQQILPLPTDANSGLDESSPYFSATGDTIFFSRAKYVENPKPFGVKGEILYSVKQKDGNWSTSKPLASNLNKSGTRSVLLVKGNIMYLGGHQVSKSNENKKSQGISIARLQEGKWLHEENVKINSLRNSSGHESYYLDPKLRFLLIAMNSYASRGNEDIYVSFNVDGDWQRPINLGNDINTNGQEVTPYMDASGEYLYFSSNGHPGIGGFDVFVSRRLDDSWQKWTTPENIGAKINSEGSEQYFRWVGDQKAVWVSTTDSRGYGDIVYADLSDVSLPGIYESTSEKPLVFSSPEKEKKEAPNSMLPDQNEIEIAKVSTRKLNLKIRDEDGEKVDAIIKITSDGYGSEINLIEKKTDDGELTYTFLENVYYTVLATQEGYMSSKKQIMITEATKSNYLEIQLRKIEKGKSFNYSDILFYTGTDSLLESSYVGLQEVLTSLEKNPELKLKIIGHTDNQGTAQLNFELSELRAERVKRYLTAAGVSATRLTTQGMGGAKAIASNKNEEGRGKNRRVEFQVE